MSDDLMEMRTSTFLADKSIREFSIPEEVIAGFIVIAIFVGEVHKGRFLGLKSCHCDYLAFCKVIVVLAQNVPVKITDSDKCYVSDGLSDCIMMYESRDQIPLTGQRTGKKDPVSRIFRMYQLFFSVRSLNAATSSNCTLSNQCSFLSA